LIRILHIVHALARTGGLSNFVMSYYRNIDRTKIQFDFVYFKEVDSDFKDEITALGGKFYRFPEPSLGNNYRKHAEAFFKEHTGEYKAIHCHVLFAVAAYAKIAEKYGIKNIIAHAHTNSFGTNPVKKIRNFILNRIASLKANHYFACSSEAAVLMYGRKKAKKKARVISNAVDIDKYIFSEEIRKKVRTELGILEDTFVLGHVGAFAPLKNHKFIVDIFHEIYKKNPDSRLLFIGGDGMADGSTKPEILSKVKALGIERNVDFLGVRNDVNNLLMAMDAFVLPSLIEGFGIVLVEAQATGVFCVASDVVPKETKCTENVKYLKLSDGAHIWSECVLKNRKYQRKSEKDKFPKYDINVQKNVLENLYMDMEQRK